MKIPFTNIYQQYLECQPEIDSAIAETIKSSSFITGLDVTVFEKTMAEFVGTEACSSTGSGTMALMCSLRAAGINSGDEIITTPHTFVGTTGAICAVGAIPVFADIDPATHLINLDQVLELITPKTKAILSVDIYGQCPDLDKLRKICDANNLVMIQDAAHSLGGSWQGEPIGNQADFTCFSFNPVKNLGAMGDAGCVVGNKDRMAKVNIFRDHGRTDRYVFKEIGYNARIDNMQANIVMAKMPKLKIWIERKNRIADFYTNELNSLVQLVETQPGAGHARYVYVIQTPHRDGLKAHLEGKGIATNIHYATTTHVQSAFKQWYRHCPVAERTVREILSLPCWPSLSDLELTYIVDSVKEYLT